jgi:hypothetical protein
MFKVELCQLRADHHLAVGGRRVQTVVVLMVIFRRIKGPCGSDLRDDGSIEVFLSRRWQGSMSSPG